MEILQRFRSSMIRKLTGRLGLSELQPSSGLPANIEPKLEEAAGQPLLAMPSLQEPPSFAAAAAAFAGTVSPLCAACAMRSLNR